MRSNETAEAERAGQGIEEDTGRAEAMTEPETVQGYAVVEDNTIEIRTVSPTRRAAMVNWLVVRKNCMIYRDTSDDLIEKMWEHWSGSAEVAPVNVSGQRP